MAANVPTINTIAKKIALVFFVDTILLNIKLYYTLIISEIRHMNNDSLKIKL